MCIKDPINKTCWKNGKDPSNGIPKIIFEIIQKTRFPVFAKFSQAMDEVENFLANFQILGPLGYQRWVVMPKNVKEAKVTAP